MKYRVGRKQNRVILDEKGHKVAEFEVGQEYLCQRICNMINEQIVLYEALFMIEESGYATISIHKTLQGARNALAKEVRKQKRRHNEIYNYNLENMPYRFGHFESWSVSEIEIKE